METEFGGIWPRAESPSKPITVSPIIWKRIKSPISSTKSFKRSVAHRQPTMTRGLHPCRPDSGLRPGKGASGYGRTPKAVNAPFAVSRSQASERKYRTISTYGESEEHCGAIILALFRLFACRARRKGIEPSLMEWTRIASAGLGQCFSWIITFTKSSR